MGSLFSINVQDVGAAGSIAKSFNQTAHGFSVGHVIRRDGAVGFPFELALATTTENSEVVAIVQSIIDNDNFNAVFSGIALLGSDFMDGTSPISTDFVTTPGVGLALFLSDVDEGQMVAADPFDLGDEVSKPIAIVFSDTELLVINTRGLILDVS